MNRVVIRPVALSAALAVAACSQAAFAQGDQQDENAPPCTMAPVAPGRPGTRVYAPVIPARRVVTTEEQVPNAGLIGSGVVLFGLSYGTSIVVGAASEREADQNLFVPIAGPWMDLADRGPCREGMCGSETANKVLLAANGVIQSVGALQILAGFLFPETRITTRTAKNGPEVHVTPIAGPRMVGLTARGTF